MTELVLEPFPAGHIRCPRCRLLKPEDDFSYRNRALGLRSIQCRECFRAIRRERLLNGKLSAYHVKRRDRQTDGQLRRNFGIGLSEYAALLEAQGGVCAICKKPEQARARGMTRLPDASLPIKRLSVDHDHITGKIRGLLCSGCNPGIGHFRDDPLLLRRAARYLELFSISQFSDMPQSIS